MRTRTLLLLAIGCGLAILVAGLFLLLRIDRAPAGSERYRVGDTATAGDLTVTVTSSSEVDGYLRVGVTLRGVDDTDVLEDFRLVVAGALLAPLPPEQAGAEGCGAATVAEQSCQLVFGTTQVQGSTRSLLLRRGEDQRRWDLAGS